MLAASTGGGLMSSQHYDVRWIREVDEVVAVRLGWRGTIARDAGRFRRGQELTRTSPSSTAPATV